ncbi:MAG: cytochrome c oxidase subunit II [Phycisphaerales bacterium]|nr:cytochrome c oxidase subunit II [Phycisphaerales bacterium]
MSNFQLTLALNDWLTRVWLLPGNSDLAPATDWLFMFIMWVCIISFVALMIPMFYWTIRWRRKPGVPPIRTPNHNTALEITWVVGPLIVVTFIFFWGFHGYMNAQIPQGNVETISITGKKWAWSGMYANGAGSGESAIFDNNVAKNANGDQSPGQRGNTEVPVFVVPEGVSVKFMLTSSDVMHSFYIPDMRTKMDMFPNRTTSLTFVPQNSDPSKSGAVNIGKGDGKPGRDHYVFCAEYCGDNHSEMGAIIRVLPMDLYKATVEEWGNVTEVLPLVDVGKFVYEKRGCAQCHSIDGKPGTGPSWKGYYGKPVEFSSSSGPTWDLNTDEGWENYIRESIYTPGVKIHSPYPNQMASYAGQLNERAIQGVAAYMRQLAGRATDEDKEQPPAKKK